MSCKQALTAVCWSSRLVSTVLRAIIRAIKGLVALTALEMDWTENDTVKTTVNNISNITFIEL